MDDGTTYEWKQASAKYRKDIARALTAAAPTMFPEGRGRPEDAAHSPGSLAIRIQH